jgi:hypothetical protein
LPLRNLTIASRIPHITLREFVEFVEFMEFIE